MVDVTSSSRETLFSVGGMPIYHSTMSTNTVIKKIENPNFIVKKALNTAKYIKENANPYIITGILGALTAGLVMAYIRQDRSADKQEKN